MGQEEVVFYFVQAHNPQNEGKWMLRFGSEISYLSPSLYAALFRMTYEEVLGQTMADGTTFTLEKALFKGRTMAETSSCGTKKSTMTPVTRGVTKTRKKATTESTTPKPQKTTRSRKTKTNTLTPTPSDKVYYSGLDKKNISLLASLRKVDRMKGDNTMETEFVDSL